MCVLGLSVMCVFFGGCVCLSEYLEYGFCKMMNFSAVSTGLGIRRCEL